MKIPSRILARIRKVKAKRPKTVLDHILKHGQVTTQELRDLYGYNHPPRAARDVRELGIELETFRVVGEDGRKIAGYRLALLPAGRPRRGRGRHSFPKALKDQLLARDGPRCRICSAEMPARYLQIDHRVPYEVAGEEPHPELRPSNLMLLCSSCNRAKSWSCEHCRNLKGPRSIRTCRRCYWARPRRHHHVAMVPQRRLELTWSGEDQILAYERLVETASRRGRELQEFVLQALADIATEGDWQVKPAA